MKRFLLLGAAALSLSACAAVGVKSPITQADQSKTLYVAEAGFDAATLAVEASLKAGALKGADAQQARVLLERGHGALLIARTAYSAGNTADLNTALSDLGTAVSQANALLKR